MGSQTKQQTQKTEPWGPSVGYRTNIMSQAANAYNALQGPQAPSRDSYYVGTPSTYNMVPTFSGNSTGTINNGYRMVTTPGTRTFDAAGYNNALAKYNTDKASYVDPTAQAYRDYIGALQNTPLENNAYNELNNTIQGNYLQGNPYLETMIGNTNAGINANFSGAGRYASGAHAGYLANADNQLRYQNYDAERARQMAALGMAPQISALRYSPYQQSIAANQGLEDLPMNRLARYTDVINAASGNGGQVSTPIYRNQTAGALGGALAGGAGLYAAGATGFLPIGAAALAGGLLGGFA